MVMYALATSAGSFMALLVVTRLSSISRLSSEQINGPPPIVRHVSLFIRIPVVLLQPMHSNDLQYGVVGNYCAGVGLADSCEQHVIERSAQ